MPNDDGELGRELRLKQFELVYDYIKFHIGLYIGTPPVFAFLGEAFGVQKNFCFRMGLGLMIVIYCVSGIHAGRFMGKHIICKWEGDFLGKFEANAFTRTRIFMHHGLYWIGLGSGLLGLLVAVFYTYLIP